MGVDGANDSAGIDVTPATADQLTIANLSFRKPLGEVASRDRYGMPYGMWSAAKRRAAGA